MFNLCLSVVFSLVFEQPDKKTRVILVLIAFTQWFFEHTYKVFDEIPMMT
jgi:hypothetical protein